jgi:membrane protein required for colicin V production
MNWFDLAVLLIVAGGALRGFSTGIIREALSIVGLVGGIVLAGQRYQALADRLTFISDARMASIVAFAVIFLAAMIAANLLGQIIHRMAKLAMMGCADRALGLAFGAIEAVVVIQIVLLLLLQFPFFGPPDFLQGSTLSVPLLKYSSYTSAILPAEFSGLFDLLKGI